MRGGLQCERRVGQAQVASGERYLECACEVAPRDAGGGRKKMRAQFVLLRKLLASMKHSWSTL
eukprot:2056615-Prymnesium_polylepis.1